MGHQRSPDEADRQRLIGLRFRSEGGRDPCGGEHESFK